MTTSPRPTLREQTRSAVRASIAEVALELFAEHGFDNVTVEQISREAGVSTRSFNRYFSTKEDAALGDVERWGRHVRETFAARPVREHPWASLRCAFASLLTLSDLSGDHPKRGVRVLNNTPSLRARNHEKHLAWVQLLAPMVATRLNGPDVSLRSVAMTQAGIACFETALQTWAEPDETRTPADLLTIAFGSLVELAPA